MSSTFYFMQPVYKIEIYANNNGNIGSLRHTFGFDLEKQVSNWNIKFGMTKAISSFEIEIPETGEDATTHMVTGETYSDIDVFDFVKIWYGYTGEGQGYSDPYMFIGRIDTKKVEMNENGCIRTFAGRDLGEILFRHIQRRSFTGSTEQTVKEILSSCSIETGGNYQTITPHSDEAYFFTANKSSFDSLQDIAKLDKNDFYIGSGSSETNPHLHVFEQNSKYASGEVISSFVEGENIFSYSLVRDIGEVKNDVYVFGQEIDSLNSGSFFPQSRHEFTDNFSSYDGFSGEFATYKSFYPQWHGTLWNVVNYSGSGHPQEQYFLPYTLGYNAAQHIVGYPWPYLCPVLPILDTEGSGYNLLTSIMSIRIDLFTGQTLGNWSHGWYTWIGGDYGPISGSGTIFTPKQTTVLYSDNIPGSYAWFHVLPENLSPGFEIKSQVETNSWYAITLLLDMDRANKYLVNDLEEPGLEYGSFRSSPALMLNSGDTMVLTYGQTYNAIDSGIGYVSSIPEAGISGSMDTSIQLKQINQYEQWWVILGSNKTQDEGGRLIPTDYFACAVEAPELRCDILTEGIEKSTLMSIELPVGPEFEGTSSPNLRGQHSGSYKWTRYGKPDWYNITYAGIMFEFKTPNRSDVSPDKVSWDPRYWIGPFASTSQLGKLGGTRDITYNVFIENMYFKTRFQGHTFDINSIKEWGLRPSITSNMRNASNEMCHQESKAILDQYKRPITTIDVETYAQPYTLGSMYTLLLNSEPNLQGLEGKLPNSFTLIEYEVNWENNKLYSKCTLTNLPGIRYPPLFTNYHMQPTLYAKGLWDYIAPYFTSTIDQGPPKYN